MKTEPHKTSLRLYHPFFSHSILPTLGKNFRLKIRTIVFERVCVYAHAYVCMMPRTHSQLTPVPVDGSLDVGDGEIVLLVHCGSWIARIRANEVVPSTFLSRFPLSLSLSLSFFLCWSHSHFPRSLRIITPTSPPSSSTFSGVPSVLPGTPAFRHPRLPCSRTSILRCCLRTRSEIGNARPGEFRKFMDYEAN